MTGGQEEVPCLILHACPGEPFPEHFKIPGCQHPGELRNLRIIRIHRILSDFVGDNGLVGNQPLCLMLHPDCFHAGSILDFQLCRFCLAGFCLFRENQRVIAVIGGGPGSLDMSQGPVAACIGAPDEPLLAEPHPGKEIILLQNTRPELKVIGALGVQVPGIRLAVTPQNLRHLPAAAPQLVAQGQHAEGGVAAEGTEHAEALLHQV